MIDKSQNNYIVVPLYEPARCLILTKYNVQCTNDADWQLSNGNTWEPICYECMRECVSAYRFEIGQTHAELDVSSMHPPETDKLKKKTLS